MRLAIRGLILLALVVMLQPQGIGATAPTRLNLEDLQYRVSLGAWQDLARVNLTFRQLGPGRYLAEATTRVEGVWRLASRWLPESYQTEMVYREGQLRPLVYREVFHAKGKRVCKETRFDYDAGRISLRRQVEGREKDEVWQAPMKGPIYDPLSICYNLRLGAFGPLAPGQSLHLSGIPYPKPEEITLSLGPDREVMVSVKETDSLGEITPIFVSFDPKWVPTQAWTRVQPVGKVTGELVNARGSLAGHLAGGGAGEAGVAE